MEQGVSDRTFLLGCIKRDAAIPARNDLQTVVHVILHIYYTFL